MLSRHLLIGAGLLATSFFPHLVTTECYDPSPVFHPPALTHEHFEVDHTFSVLEASLAQLAARDEYAGTSFAVEVTSTSQSLWDYHHTASQRNATRPGANITRSVAFRIASITKTFTVLGILQQHAAGNLSLEDTVDKYLPTLGKKSKGGIPWKDITIRSLGSQLSGIPNDWAQSDLLNVFDDPVAHGFPPVPNTRTPPCDGICNADELFHDVDKREPLFPPNAQSSYSNLAFELLGLVIANVSGLPYEQYIEEAILAPLNMSHTSFSTPKDENVAIPIGENWLGHDEGVQNPTGGLYSTTADLSKFLRYVLTHYNGFTPSLNWLQPFSYGTGIQSFYGMPWEIYRTSSILPKSKRPVTFVTKAGGLPGYFSNIIMLPEYDLAVTILIASADPTPLGQLREVVTVALVRAAEVIAQKDLKKRYTGTYSSKKINSTVTVEHDHSTGLHVTEWISNSTDMLELTGAMARKAGLPNWIRIQMVPTLLFKNEEKKRGEIWRAIVLPTRPSEDSKVGYWDEFCITAIDGARYGGLPLNEAVAWASEDPDDTKIQHLEVPSLRITLDRVDPKEMERPTNKEAQHVLGSSA